jgi:hypothetical protein
MAFNFSRYNNRDILRLSSPQYTKQLSMRKLRYIDHFSTPNVRYPSDELLGRLTVDNEIWGVGSRFYKIAAKHYGDASLWWIIPWFNKLPLESDYEAGEIVLVPQPLKIVLSFFEERNE